MLDWLSERHHDRETLIAGQLIENSIVKLLISNRKTKDLGGEISTQEFTSLVSAGLYT